MCRPPDRCENRPGLAGSLVRSVWGRHRVGVLPGSGSSVRIGIWELEPQNCALLVYTDTYELDQEDGLTLEFDVQLDVWGIFSCRHMSTPL